MVEPLDACHDLFKKLVSEIADYAPTIETETETRTKVITRILVEVLQWPHASMREEPATGRGFVDYLMTVEGRGRLVVEAKRDGRDLGTAHRPAGRAFKLNGPVFDTEAAKEGIYQAIVYCGMKSSELACVTNGREWIVFRGSRLGDGRDTMDGYAFVFPSLESISDNFKLFYDLLAHEQVRSFAYRPYFSEAEGMPIRTAAFSRAVKPPNAARLVTHGELASDIGRVMDSFFRRLSGDDDPRLIAECFVVTKESDRADEHLCRVSEELVTSIKILGTNDATDLTRIIERAKETQKHEFVIIVGMKGAGKSTFIDRFFSLVLKKEIADDCVVIRINLSDSNGNADELPQWLDWHLLEAAEAAIFQGHAPTYEELQGMYFGEYQRLMVGPWRDLYNSDKTAFKIQFGRHIEERRENRPHEHIQRLLCDVVANRKKLPVVVLDNADHFDVEFQEKAYQYARSIYEVTACLVLTPITDRTSWQLSKQGALQSFDHTDLYLPTPSTRTILAKRIEYLEKRVAEEKVYQTGDYFFGRGIALSLDDLAGFAACLQRVFLETPMVSRWIANLSNRDVRRALELARFLVSSPHLQVSDLLKAYIAKSALEVPRWRIQQAIVLGKYDLYISEHNAYVQNIFNLSEDIETSPLLGLRLLQLLRDAPKDTADTRYITTDQVYDYASGMQLEPRPVTLWLDALLKTGQIISYSPLEISVERAGKIQLSPAGLQHLIWGQQDWKYWEIMAAVTPIRDEQLYEDLHNIDETRPARHWEQTRKFFATYLLEEDRKFCVVPEHDAYAGQRKLTKELAKAVQATVPSTT